MPLQRHLLHANHAVGCGVTRFDVVSATGVPPSAGLEMSPVAEDFIRITRDVTFHRDVLRPKLLSPGTAAKEGEGRMQFSLDFDDE
jgi:hypothetical protein